MPAGRSTQPDMLALQTAAAVATSAPARLAPRIPQVPGIEAQASHLHLCQQCRDLQGRGRAPAATVTAASAACRDAWGSAAPQQAQQAHLHLPLHRLLRQPRLSQPRVHGLAQKYSRLQVPPHALQRRQAAAGAAGPGSTGGARPASWRQVPFRQLRQAVVRELLVAALQGRHASNRGASCGHRPEKRGQAAWHCCTAPALAHLLRQLRLMQVAQQPGINQLQILWRRHRHTQAVQQT